MIICLETAWLEFEWRTEQINYKLSSAKVDEIKIKEDEGEKEEKRNCQTMAQLQLSLVLA